MSILSFFGLGPTAAVTFAFDDSEKRKTVEIRGDKGAQRLLVYEGDEPVKGTVSATVKAGQKIEHQGIKLEFIGEIELIYDRGNHHDFTSVVSELAPAGELSGDAKWTFNFNTADKSNESYNGLNVRLRYYLKFTIVRGFASNITNEQEIWVMNYGEPPEMNQSIKMEVGIEDCLHIEFEYGRSKYHLQDTIVGKIYFLLVRIKIKYMEIALIRRESTGSPPNVYNESETITKFEIMDGAPVRGESIPIRLFLSAFDLTPTYKNIHNKFSVKYYLNLVLVDEDDRRYFKQTDITLWRKRAGTDEKRLQTVKDIPETTREKKKRHKREKKEKEAADKVAGAEDGTPTEQPK